MAQLTSARVVMIGAGNVATHLAMALAGHNHVLQCVSRNGESAAKLAAAVNTFYETNKLPQRCLCGKLDSLIGTADYYIIAANDDAIASIVADTPDFPGVWAHTSGSVDASVFSGHKNRYGVFYPLQTFSKEIPVDFSLVPMFIEGSDEPTCRALIQLASTISNSVTVADSQKRATLHLAAVFACNFANQMWVEADSILRHNGLGISYLLPLLQGTLNKLKASSPIDAMTGPARRGDIQIILKHRAELSGTQLEIYNLITDRILTEFNK